LAPVVEHVCPLLAMVHLPRGKQSIRCDVSIARCFTHCQSKGCVPLRSLSLVASRSSPRCESSCPCATLPCLGNQLMALLCAKYVKLEATDRQ